MKTNLHIEAVAESQGLLGANGTSAGARFAAILGTLLQAVMAIALLILFYFLISGAFDWLTSGGDKSKIESARNKIMNGIIGILILSSTLAIFMFVQTILGISVLTFSMVGGDTTPPTQNIQYACLSTGSSICPSGNSGVNYSLCSTGCGPPQVCCTMVN